MHVAFSVGNLHFVSIWFHISHFSFTTLCFCFYWACFPWPVTFQSIWTGYGLPDFHYHTFPYSSLLQEACHFTNCSSSEIMSRSEMKALFLLLVPRKWPKHLQMLMGFQKGKWNVVSARRLFNYLFLLGIVRPEAVLLGGITSWHRC